MTTDVQHVYAYHRAYELQNGYAPTLAEAYHALGISQRRYYAARTWLIEHGFLRKQGRRWRGVRVNLRLCRTCGVEITPALAILDATNGRRFVRGVCRTCFNAARTPQHRAWLARNPGYNARMLRRLRQAQRGISP